MEERGKTPSFIIALAPISAAGPSFPPAASTPNFAIGGYRRVPNKPGLLLYIGIEWDKRMLALPLPTLVFIN